MPCVVRPSSHRSRAPTSRGMRLALFACCCSAAAVLTSSSASPSSPTSACAAAALLREHASTYAAFAASHAAELLTPLGTGERRGPNYRQLCDLAIVNHSLVLVGAGTACAAAVAGEGPPGELGVHYYAGALMAMLEASAPGTVPDVRLRFHANACEPIDERSGGPWLTWCGAHPNRTAYRPLIVPAFHDAPCYTISKTISAERKQLGEWGNIRFTIRDVLRMRRRKQRERTWAERAPVLVWRGSSTGTRIDCRKCRLQYGLRLKPNRETHPRQRIAMLSLERPDLINASLSLRPRRVAKSTIKELLALAKDHNGSGAFVEYGTPGARRASLGDFEQGESHVTCVRKATHEPDGSEPNLLPTLVLVFRTYRPSLV